MKQLTLILDKKYAHRKVRRAISLRGANHVVLKARTPILRRHAGKIYAVIYETQKRFGIKLRAVSVMSNHMHLVIRVHSRKQFADALRFLAGMIALKVARQKLWITRAWSRTLNYGRDQQRAEIYVWRNALHAGIFNAIDCVVLRAETLLL